MKQKKIPMRKSLVSLEVEETISVDEVVEEPVVSESEE